VIDFANLPADEQAIYFQQTAEKMDLPGHLVEKDFWVCFTLQTLFSLEDFKDHLTFKGGTSLSKVYKVIDRFSEDIDFAVQRDWLGFGGDNAPDAIGISGEQRNKRLQLLSKACLNKIRDELVPSLDTALAGILKRDGWSLEFNENERNNQQIYFKYPQSRLTPESSYNPPFVRVELTARTDNHPAETATIFPYVAEQIDSSIGKPEVLVNVLKPERTFWEKATILHQFHFQTNPEKIAPGFLRHYYDVSHLDSKGYSNSAIEQIELLPEVADHKNTYYRQAWARYDLARNHRTFELIPHDNIVSTIKADYEEMQEMMFGDTPLAFDAILQQLHELKQKINSLE
jgi:hypothetical protein